MFNKKINLLSSITRHDILNQLMVLKGYLSLWTTMVENPVLLDYINRELGATQTIEHQITFTRDYENLGVKAPDWQSVNVAVLKANMLLSVAKFRLKPTPGIRMSMPILFLRRYCTISPTMPCGMVGIR